MPEIKPVLAIALRKLTGEQPAEETSPDASHDDEERLADLEAIMNDFDSADTPRERAKAILAAIERANPFDVTSRSGE